MYPIVRKITCKFPGNPENGRSLPRQVKYEVDDVVNFDCLDGYSLIGMKTARCDKDGQFPEKIPTCKR